jgi:hypothetical protein
LALATLQYEGRFKTIPGLFESIDPERIKTVGGYPNATWPVLLLGDLERRALTVPVRSEDTLSESSRAYVEVYVCPSDGSKLHLSSDMSYVANGGKFGPVINQKLANGPFINRVYQPNLKMLEGHWMDGREYTLLYSESMDTKGYDDMGWNGWLDSNTPYTLDSEFIKDLKDRAWGPVFFWSVETYNNKRAVAPMNLTGWDLTDVQCKERVAARYSSSSCTEDPGKKYGNWARPSSFHSGGVNVAFASGRVMYLKETIDYGIYIALMTPYELKSDSPSPTYVLKDNVYQ